LEEKMKRLLMCVLLSAAAAGAAFADPVGLRLYIDGLYFGDVMSENYKFAGKGSGAFINPGIEFAKSLGAFRFSTSLEDMIGFSDPGYQKLQWTLTGSYMLQLAETSRLSFLVYNLFHLDGADDKFADPDLDQITDEIGPGIRFDQTFGFGSIYAMTEFNIRIHSQENRKIDLETGIHSGFKLGWTTNAGIWGYVRPYISFLKNGEAPEQDALEKIEIRVGYTNSVIEARVTVGIPTVEDGIKNGGFSTKAPGLGRYGGLFIQPRITYTFMPGLSAYAEAWVINLGAEEPLKVGIIPKIGVSYSF
jgi:hypothetical protein